MAVYCMLFTLYSCNLELEIKRVRSRRRKKQMLNLDEVKCHVYRCVQRSEVSLLSCIEKFVALVVLTRGSKLLANQHVFKLITTT